MSEQLAIREEPSIGLMIQSVLQSGMTGEAASVVERLCALKERQDAKDAERAFNRAFAALQSETSTIKATKVVPTKTGGEKFKYAPYEEIMALVRPLLQKHGFAVTFDLQAGEARIKAVCTLIHSGGHSRSTEFSARVGSGPPGATECQADGAAASYAKRYALCGALNIVIERDTDGVDARNLGRPITKEWADWFRAEVKATGADEKRFLAFAGAASYEGIMDSKRETLQRELSRKGATAAAPATIARQEEQDEDGNFTWK